MIHGLSYMFDCIFLCDLHTHVLNLNPRYIYYWSGLQSILNSIAKKLPWDAKGVITILSPKPLLILMIAKCQKQAVSWIYLYL